MDAKCLFLVQSLLRLHLERQLWSVGISSSSLPSTCWEVCAFRLCVLPEPGHRSIAPCQRWMIQFPRLCKGNRIFFITFPYSVYTIIAARICVLHEKVQSKEKGGRTTSGYWFIMWKREKKYFKHQTSVKSPTLCPPCAFEVGVRAHFQHLLW